MIDLNEKEPLKHFSQAFFPSRYMNPHLNPILVNIEPFNGY